MDPSTDLSMMALQAVLSTGPWGVALAFTLYVITKWMTTAAEHLCELFPKVLSIADRLVDKGLEFRLKTYHYTIEEDPESPEEP